MHFFLSTMAGQLEVSFRDVADCDKAQTLHVLQHVVFFSRQTDLDLEIAADGKNTPVRLKTLGSYFVTPLAPQHNSMG